MSHPDLDRLLDFLLRRAQELLGKYGEFYPFAAALTTEGAVVAVAGYPGGEKPPSAEVIDLLVEALQDGVRKGEFRACGICADVRVLPPNAQAKTEAVRVSLEHARGEAVTVYLPYQKRFPRRIAYGELFAMQATPQLFAVDT